MVMSSALPIAALLSGCGPAATGGTATKYAGPEQAVATVVDDLGKAIKVGDTKKICSQILAPALAAKITSVQKSPCDKALTKLMATGDDSSFSVDAVTLSGDHATASVHTGSGKGRRQATLGFDKTASKWRISSLGS